jgi:hypothetical protein
MGSRLIFLPFLQGAHEGRIRLIWWRRKLPHVVDREVVLNGASNSLSAAKALEAYRQMMSWCREKLVGR